MLKSTEKLVGNNLFSSILCQKNSFLPSFCLNLGFGENWQPVVFSDISAVLSKKVKAGNTTKDGKVEYNAYKTNQKADWKTIF